MPSGFGRPADTDGIRSSSFRSSRSVAIEQRTVERERLLRDRVPRVAACGGRTGGFGEPLALVRLVEQLLDRGGERTWGVRRHGARDPLRSNLLEAADGRENDRLPERERGVENARLVDLAVRQRDDAGAPEERRNLRVLDE